MPKTTSSPFSGLSPRKTTRKVTRIDVEMLSVCNDAFPGVRSSPEGKYDAIFSSMKPGQAIKCESIEASALARAMQTWLKNSGKHQEFEVRQMARYPEGGGRVWMLPKKSKLKAAA